LVSERKFNKILSIPKGVAVAHHEVLITSFFSRANKTRESFGRRSFIGPFCRDLLTEFCNLSCKTGKKQHL